MAVLKYKDPETGEVKTVGGSGGGSGDMSASVYDPQGKAQDVFKYVDDAIQNSGGNEPPAAYSMAGLHGNVTYWKSANGVVGINIYSRTSSATTVSYGDVWCTLPEGFRPIYGTAIIPGMIWTGAWASFTDLIPACFSVETDGRMSYLGKTIKASSGYVLFVANGTFPSAD